ncbi:MAG: F0F1 ATP synthase subunit delta [Cellulomonadaceae bacterium]
MRGTSLHSLTVVRNRFAPVLRAAGAEAAGLGEQIFAVLDAVDGSGALLRGLSDPSRRPEDKTALVSDLLSDGFDARTVTAVSDLVRQRWTSDQDLADGLETLAVDAVLLSAESRGALDEVENELFTIVRALIGHALARRALTDPGAPRELRVRLIDQILGGGGDPATRLLAERAAGHPRGQRFAATLGRYGDQAAELRDRLVANVTTGSAFTRAQLDRVAQLLQNAYGRPVQLNVAVDPEFLGGLRIQVGADVVDATMLARLADARRRMAS